ncbi:hypothetical protein C0993_004837, partial [Termitomyces sp. T159_Od127]
MVTKDEMGLIRAHAVGVEQLVFPKDTGRGVIEAIRLAMGVLLATDHELGQHPSFFLRSVKKKFDATEDDDTNATMDT